MKTTRNLFRFTLVALFVFGSCGKYDEGPALSLLSKKARISGEWKIDKVLINGEESEDEAAQFFNAITFILEKDGTGTQKIDAISYTVGDQTFETDAKENDLEWELSDNKEIYRMRIKEQDEWDDWEDMTIRRLSNSEFWLDQKIEDEQWELFLEKK